MDSSLDFLSHRVLMLEEDMRTLRAHISATDKQVHGMHELIPHQVRELEAAVRGQGKRMDRMDGASGNIAKRAWVETAKAVLSGIIGAVGTVLLFLASGGKLPRLP